MEIKYINEIKGNYMVLELDSKIQENNFEEKMIENNDICGFLKFEPMVINNEKRYMYEINSRQSMEKYFMVQPMGVEEIKAFVIDLNKALSGITEYLLNNDGLLLKKQSVFFNPSTKNFEFCFCPGYRGDFMAELRELFQFIISRIDHDNQQSVYLGYDLQELSLRDNFCMDLLLERINSVEEIKEKEAKTEDVENYDLEKELEINVSSYLNEKEPKMESAKDVEVKDKLKDFLKAKIFVAKKELQVSEAGFENEDLGILKDAGKDFEVGKIETDCFETGDLPDLGLSRKLIKIGDLKKKYEIGKSPYIIGKQDGGADMVIGNKMVSRFHAVITYDENNYYIEDMNSTNGTYINERRAEPYKKYKLSKGDVIGLANINYEFC